MAGYYVPTGIDRVYFSKLEDAYRGAAAILLGAYRMTEGRVHNAIPGYTSSDGIPIYNSATGRTATHWVAFYNGSNPKDGYEKVTYSKTYGVARKGPYKFPKNW